MTDPRDATPTISAANDPQQSSLPFMDTRDQAASGRGFVAALDSPVIAGGDGNPVWDCSEFGFLEDSCPPTANPSLWRQSGLVAKHGLYEVTDRIYQVRGFDLSNMTIVEGDSGVIVIDPLISSETASAGWHSTAPTAVSGR